MTARMKNPGMIITEAMAPAQAPGAAARRGGVPAATLDLLHLRASQVNGCSACVEAGWRSARKAGETDERLFAVAALPLAIAVTNFYNRLNAPTRPVAGVRGG